MTQINSSFPSGERGGLFIPLGIAVRNALVGVVGIAASLEAPQLRLLRGIDSVRGSAVVQAVVARLCRKQQRFSDGGAHTCV